MLHTKHTRQDSGPATSLFVVLMRLSLIVTLSRIVRTLVCDVAVGAHSHHLSDMTIGAPHLSTGPLIMKTAVWRRLPARLPYLPGGFLERPFVADGNHDAGSFGGHREGDGPAQAPARGTRGRDLPVEAEIRASASSRVSQAARLLAPGDYALRPEDALEFLDECFSVHDKPPKPGGTARSRWCGSGGGRGWCSP